MVENICQMILFVIMNMGNKNDYWRVNITRKK